MNKKIITIFALLSLMSVLIIACSGGRDSTTTDTSSSGYNSAAPANPPASGASEVHLAATNFVQTSITISKGSKITLINDTTTVHNIQNGTWKDSTATSLKEKDAPAVSVAFTGNDTHEIGPFPVAGTYHLYCTVHEGMNLTVIVQ